MSQVLTCPQGHQWQPLAPVSSGDHPGATGPMAVCPVCGGTALLDPAPGNSSEISEAATIPPSHDPGESASSTGTAFSHSASGPARDEDRPRVPGYEVLEELGRGGMGVVYKARQTSLKRLVALKMLRPGAGSTRDELARFQAEAEAVARLHHPHIVQIYEVGESDGFPFFSLEFIAGGSLAGKLNGTPQPPRQAAQLIQILAWAVQHAHEHGIIHRDLKPANILLVSGGVVSAERPKEGADSAARDSLLTKYQPKITDFGLAKPIDRESGLTKAGAIIGTPSYMAPEQAGGRAVGTPADVYALGAILYELLAGRPPFRASTTIDTVLQVLNDEVVPPGRLHPKLPRDLETICLKCLEKEPRKRYVSAVALAEDLGRFLAREPILARSIGPLAKAVKWTRRRPAAAALVFVTGLAALVLAGVIIVSNLRLTEERDYAVEQRNAATKAKEEADQQRRRAQTNFEWARQAVDQMLTRVGDERMRNIPLLEELQRDLLEDALKFNQRFLQQQSSDPQVRLEASRAYARAARIRGMLGQQEQAVAGYQEAIKLMRQLAAEHPGDPAYRHELAECLQGVGSPLMDMARHTEADEAYAEAETVMDALAAKHPGESSYRQELAAVYNRRGLLYAAISKFPEAEAAYRRAIDVQKQLAQSFPHETEFRRDLALTLNNFGIWWANYGRRDKAEESFRQAIAYQDALAAESPKEVAYRQELARSHINLGNVLAEQGKIDEAEKAYRKTMGIQQALISDFPRVPLHRQSLAQTQFNLGLMLDTNNRQPEAETAYRQSITLLEPLVAEYPKVPHYRLGLAGSFNNLGAVLADLGRKDDALEARRRAVASFEALVAAFPEHRYYHSELARVFDAVANLLREQNELSEAQHMVERAIGHQQAAMKIAPGHRRYHLLLSQHFLSLAEIQLARKDHAAAAESTAELSKLSPAGWETYYVAATVLSRCVPLAEKDPRLPETTRQALARSYAQQAVQRLREAILNGFKDAAQLQKDAGLAALRARPEFKMLLVEMGKN